MSQLARSPGYQVDSASEKPLCHKIFVEEATFQVTDKFDGHIKDLEQATLDSYSIQVLSQF